MADGIGMDLHRWGPWVHCDSPAWQGDFTVSIAATAATPLHPPTLYAVRRLGFKQCLLSVCLSGWLTQPVHNDTCAVVLQIDYNHFANHWGLYANNRINQAYPQYKPVLDYWPKARQQAAQYNCSGTHWPGHIAPFGPSAHLPTYMYFSRMRAAAKHS
jgi:hypothetical protein